MDEHITKKQRTGDKTDNPMLTESVKEFILQVFEAAQYLDDDGDKPKNKIWDKLPEPWKQNRDVVLAAYRYGFVKHSALVQSFMTQDIESTKSDKKMPIVQQKQQHQQRQLTNSVSGFLQFYSSLLTKTQTFAAEDRDTLLPFLRHIPEESRSKIWKSTEALHDDYEFVFDAALWSLIGLRDLPDRFRNDAGFLNSVIQAKPTTWYSLPTDWFSNPMYANNIVKFENGLARHVFERVPALRGDRDVWTRIINSYEYTENGLDALLRDFGTPENLSDRYLMMEASKKDMAVVGFIHESLFGDHAFLAELVDLEPTAFTEFSFEIQASFPDLFLRALRSPLAHLEFKKDFQRFGNRVNPSLWTDRDIIKAWCEIGGPFMERCFPKESREDKELFLWIAKHTHNMQAAYESFRELSDDLRNDKSFMRKCIELCEWVYFFSSDDIRSDFNITVLALAGSAEFANDFVRRDWESAELKALLQEIPRKLHLHDTFVQTILCGMARGSTSPLARLNQGLDTSELGYKRRFAEYLGVPIGKDFRLLQRAARNLRLKI